MKKDVRADFPLLQNESVAYLDNAATTQKPQCVLDAIRFFYERENANPLRGIYPLSVAATRVCEEARREVKDLIGAAGEREIIFTRNTTEGLNLVASGYGMNFLKPGDEVLVSILEHHSNLLPWQEVCQKTGARLCFLECEPDGSLNLEKALSKINEKTALLALTRVSNVIGRGNPVKELVAAAHRVGAVAVIDGAQSTPHQRVNVQELDADFFAFSGHKIYGPMGIGVLYGKEKWLQKMPPFLRGGEMIESVTREGAVFAELPHKFEAGTVNAAGCAGLTAAIRYVKEIGYDEIALRETQLTAYAMERMQALPEIRILGSSDPAQHHGIVTFSVEGVHPHDVSEILASDGVAVRAGHLCAQPLLEFLGCRSTVRASFSFYNTEEEIDRLIVSLRSLRERMGYGKPDLL